MRSIVALLALLSCSKTPEPARSDDLRVMLPFRYWMTSSLVPSDGGDCFFTFDFRDRRRH